jgi:CHAD domain-containing protein
VTTVVELPDGGDAIEVPEIGEGATVAELVRAGLLANVALLVEHEPIARRDEDLEGVHQARVGIRRTRSNLRTFRDLLDPEWRAPLDAELKRQAALLGDVRDLDVLGKRLRAAIDELPARDQVVALALLDRLAGQRETAFGALHAELISAAHQAFIERLVAMVGDPGFAAEARSGDDPVVDRPAIEVVPALVAKPWRKLKKAVKRLPPPGVVTHEELHEVRIKAKRARYACDAALPVVGKPAKHLAKRLGALQDVLGDLHDTSVAEDWLRAAAADVRVPRAGALAAGLLVARERSDGDALEADWPDAWAAVRSVDIHWLSR